MPVTPNTPPTTPQARTLVLFTLDYEIHGNGDGCARELMVEPTERMLDQFDRYGAKLTILADAGEILRFKEHFDRTGDDSFHYLAIEKQLRRAISTGHDVQLHIHSGYFNARHDGRSWKQDWSEYNFAGLPLERMSEMVRRGRDWLESTLRPIQPNYRCRVFRAANWSVSPSPNVVRALLDNGLEIDTSVFKFGKRTGLVTFDYSNAPSAALPWRASEVDICREDLASPLVEFPIYTENRWIGAFVSANRFYRVLQSRQHKVAREPSPGEPEPANMPPASGRLQRWMSTLFSKHAWKADFNQCTGRQLIRALLRCEAAHGEESRQIPFVTIGHSKLFTPANERSLTRFLEFVAHRNHRFGFAIFGDLHLPNGPTSHRVAPPKNSPQATARN